MHNDHNANMNAKSHEGRMELGHANIRMNVEADRLSSLPDDVIHKILSFISMRQAIETSVLSSRWRFIWTSMPYLNFSREESFPEFVSNLLSHRNNQIYLSSVKLGKCSDESVKRILNYSFSHNVQHLIFTWERDSCSGFPLSCFSSRSLKHLTLIGDVYASCPFMGTPSWDLPALTTLHLHDITLPLNKDKEIGLFTKCTNLKNLSLCQCWITGTNVFYICHPQLSNLTLEYTYCCNTVNVVAPQLKNLTIIHAFKNLLICAPALTSLVMKHLCQLQLSTQGQGLPLLEKVDLCVYYPILKEAHILVSLLEQLHTVKFLTLNLEILKLLCSLSHIPSPFANLKILKFLTSYPTRVYLEVRAHEKDGSPSAVFTIVSSAEIRVMRNIVSTQRLISEFKKQRTQSALELQRHFGAKLAQKCNVDSCLQHIKRLLSELPASKRDVMQATFSSLCEEAAIFTNNSMLDCSLMHILQH